MSVSICSLWQVRNASPSSTRLFTMSGRTGRIWAAWRKWFGSFSNSYLLQFPASSTCLYGWRVSSLAVTKMTASGGDSERSTNILTLSLSTTQCGTWFFFSSYFRPPLRRSLERQRQDLYGLVSHESQCVHENKSDRKQYGLSYSYVLDGEV